MIKLKTLLSEIRHFDPDKKEDAAEILIRKTWAIMPHGEGRYDFDNVLLYLNNEQAPNELAWKLAQKFYPEEDEPWYVFQKDVQDVLQQLELQRLERKRAATPSLKDPLYILKKLIVGKNWNSAKRAIANQFPGRIRTAVDDESAELMFNRLYKNAVGETIYSKQEIERIGFGRLNQLKMDPSETTHQQIAINAFIRTYTDNKDGFVGNVRVWRGTNSPHAQIRPGDFVTFDRGYAENYLSGRWKAIVTDILPAKDLYLYKADIGMSEMVYWPEGHEIKKYEGTIPSFREFWETYRYGL
jgi:hypothetical protein